MSSTEPTKKLTPAQKRALQYVTEGRVYVYPGIGTFPDVYMLRNGGDSPTRLSSVPFYRLSELRLIQRTPGRSSYFLDVSAVQS